MADLRTRFQAGQRGRTRISKQVQHLNRAAGISDFFCGIVPVDRLLGENPRVLKSHGLDAERKTAVPDFPHGRDGLKHIPVSSSGGGTAVTCAGCMPKRILFRGFPDNLRIGANQDDISPAFQTLPRRRVNQFIIFPV